MYFDIHRNGHHSGNLCALVWEIVRRSVIRLTAKLRTLHKEIAKTRMIQGFCLERGSEREGVKIKDLFLTDFCRDCGGRLGPHLDEGKPDLRNLNVFSLLFVKPIMFLFFHIVVLCILRRWRYYFYRYGWHSR